MQLRDIVILTAALGAVVASYYYVKKAEKNFSDTISVLNVVNRPDCREEH